MPSNVSFFDRRAENWESDCYPHAVRARLCALIPEFGVKNGECLLDVGTGPGVLIPYLCRQVGRSGRVCALDLSFEMARQAKRKGRSRRDLVIRSDVHGLPFKAGYFDRVICFAAFPHFSGPIQALTEMARVLCTGGTLIIAHLMSRSELAAHHGSNSAVAADVLPEDTKMARFFEQAGLFLLGIVDETGCYLAKGIK